MNFFENSNQVTKFRSNEPTYLRHHEMGNAGDSNNGNKVKLTRLGNELKRYIKSLFCGIYLSVYRSRILIAKVLSDKQYSIRKKVKYRK